MYEVPLSTAFRDAVRAHPACVSLVQPLQWRVPETKDALVLPSVTFSARDETPIGVGAACTATLEVQLASQSDDEADSAAQTTRANLLRVALLDVAAIVSAINAADPRLVRLSGYAVVGGGRGVDGRRWTATSLLRVGFSPAS